MSQLIPIIIYGPTVSKKRQCKIGVTDFSLCGETNATFFKKNIMINVKKD